MMAATAKSQQDGDVDTVIVSSVIPYIEDDGPACVAYPNLVSTASVANAGALHDMKIRPVKRKRSESAKDTDDDNWEMLGTSGGRDWHGRRGFEEMNSDYFIGIRNKKSRTVKFIEVDRTFSFRPSLQPSQWKDHSEDKKDEKRTYAEQRKELLQSFGGKKSIQRITRYERNKVTDDKIAENAKDQVNAAAASMKERDAREGISQVAPSTTEVGAPPHDSNAQRPEDAYPLEGLTTPNEMANLENEAQKIINGMKNPESFENPGWYKLIWELLQNITAMTNISEEERRNRLKATVYLQYLIALANASPNLNFQDQQQLISEMGVFPPILHLLLNRFTIPDPREDASKGKRIRRQEDLTRILVFAIIMWITIFGFRDCRRVGELAHALRVHEVRNFLRHAESIGCKIKKSRGQKGPEAYSISLPIPLKFPPLKKRMGKPRRMR